MYRPILALLLLILTGCRSFALEPSRSSQPQTCAVRCSISFTTTEATHSHVDVSPDGRFLLFDVLGDIYRVSIDGGDAEPVLTGPDFQWIPRYSPDGRRIAFMSDRGGAANLWVAEVDGSGARQITQGWKAQITAPIWTPAGGLLFQTVRDDAVRTHLMDGHGNKAELKMNLLPAQAQFLANGLQGYGVGTHDGSGKYRSQLPPGEISKFDVANNTVESLGIRGTQPRLSPNGARLAYVQEGRRGQWNLLVRDLATGATRVALEGMPWARMFPYSEDPVPSFSFMPDGESIVAWHELKLKRVWIGSGRVDIIPVRIRVDMQVDAPVHVTGGLRIPDSIVSKVVRWPTLNPRSGQLISSVVGKLYTTDVTTGLSRRLTSGTAFEFAPVLSPDGTRVAYVAAGAAGAGDLRIRDLHTGTEKPITPVPGKYLNPAWSPDGASVAYLQLRDDPRPGGPVDLRIADVSGTAPDRRLASLSSTSYPGERISPVLSFSRDGLHIYVSGSGALDGSQVEPRSVRIATEWVHQVEVDGSGARTCFEIPDSDEAVVSPDGARIAMVRNRRLYILDLPGCTGAQPALLDMSSAVGIDGARLPVHVAWAGNDQLLWAEGNAIQQARIGDGAKRQLTAVRVERPRDIPQGTLAIVNADIVTMRGDEVVRNGAIVIEHGRIVQVGPMRDVAIPAHATMIPADGMTVIPGLMDVHAHQLHPMELWKKQFQAYVASLAYGVTTIFDPATSTLLDPIGQAEMIEMGDILGPRILTSGPVLIGDEAAPGRSGVVSLASGADAEEAITRRGGMLAGPLKEYAYPLRAQRQWLIAVARKRGVPVVSEGRDRVMNLTRIMDGYTAVEHAFWNYPMGHDVVSLMAQTGVGYTPIVVIEKMGMPDYFTRRHDLLADRKFRRFTPTEVAERGMEERPSDWDHAERERQFLRDAHLNAKILAGGGLLSTGTHGVSWQGTHWEMEALVLGGARPHDALRAATINPARKLDLDRELGSIEPGKIADLVIVRGDPLRDIRNTQAIQYVIKGGNVFDAESMTKVWPTFEALTPWPWQLDADRRKFSAPVPARLDSMVK